MHKDKLILEIEGRDVAVYQASYISNKEHRSFQLLFEGDEAELVLDAINRRSRSEQEILRRSQDGPESYIRFSSPYIPARELIPWGDLRGIGLNDEIITAIESFTKILPAAEYRTYADRYGPWLEVRVVGSKSTHDVCLNNEAQVVAFKVRDWLRKQKVQ